MKYLTTTQFLLVLTINLVFLMLVGNHYFSETVRVVKEVQTITKYQDRIVHVNDVASLYSQLITTAQEACKNNYSGSNSNLLEFHIDNQNRPAFQCSQ